ncbi:YitT family protein, partial [Roseburia intestinalis]
VELRNYIRMNQPSAFIAITNSSEIIGKGFRGFN